MKKLMTVTVLGMLALMTASKAKAQLGKLPPPFEGTIVNAYFPSTTPGVNGNGTLRDNCDYICAEQFTIGGWGASLNRLDLGLVGTNYTVNDPATGSTSVPITCTFNVSIVSAFANGAVDYPAVYSQTEAVTIPANVGQSNVTPVAIPLTQQLPSVWVGPGNYYVMINKGSPASNGNASTGCNATLNGGTQANPPADLDWNIDYVLSVPGVGPGFFGMFNSNPATWSFVQGTFAFDLDGPILLPPPMGGGALQTARLVVKGPVTPPIGGPVEFQVGFVNVATGNLLGPLTPITVSPGPINTPGEVNPGPINFVDLNLTPYISRIGGRIEVQPVILQTPGEVNPGPVNTPGETNPGPINISATVQILDSVTGFESQLIPVVQPGTPVFVNPGPPQTPGTAVTVNPGPTQLPALSPQVLAGGQTMRFDLMGTETDACVAQVSFNDANGVLLIPAVQVNLTPGTGTTVDLNADALGLRVGQRIEVQPAITPIAPAAALAENSVCNASVEVFDHLTGRTWSHQSAVAGLSAVQANPGPTQTPGTPSSAAGTQ